MIILETGAKMDKTFSLSDFIDGRRYGPKLGMLETFNPCKYCKNDKCKRNTYGPCIKEYEKLWKEYCSKQKGQLKLTDYLVIE